MSNIEELVKAAIEEFGELAYERFTDDKGFLFESNDELNREIVGWCDIKLKPLSELFAHDVKIYGDNAYQMWGHDFLNVWWGDLIDNDEVSIVINGDKIRRKTSAALPFDLERAKAGDVVESLWVDDIWRKYPVARLRILDGYIENDIFYHDDCFINCNKLRMKFPKKVQS